MDPDKALETIRGSILAYRENGDSFNRHWDHEETLVDAVEALDEWLSKGGYLPANWDDAWHN
jgi:hypothetical protein